MLKRFAKSIARLVGAPTPIKTPIFDINAFCTNSKFSLPEHVKNWLEDSKIVIDKDLDNFIKSIQNDLTLFKKKTLDKI